MNLNESSLLTQSAIGRVLNDCEQQFFNYLGSERQAIEFAKHITLPENAPHELIENCVALILLRAKEAVSGRTEIVYVTGQRRDLGRTQ